MSEYQYYEFLAIDRSLSAKDLEELRAQSTRAQITTVSFINEYHFGDFKGNPDPLMKRYFDAHIYLANWGHCHLSLRVPRDALDFKIAAAYGTENALVINEHGVSERNRMKMRCVILNWFYRYSNPKSVVDLGVGWVSAQRETQHNQNVGLRLTA